MTTASDSLQFGPHLDVAARSSAGAGPGARAENQDNFLLIDATGKALFLHDEQVHTRQIAGWTAGHVRLCVLDGMGGHGQGREAAEAVVAELLSLAPCGSLDELSARLDAMHLSLQQHFADGCDPGKRPGTTLTLLELAPAQPALLYHVGDSRLYEIRGGRIHPLTIDHVPATAYAMEGVLGEEDWWRHVHGEHRSQISQAFILGNAFASSAALSDPLYALSAPDLPPFLRHLSDRRALELARDAVYILATDGFWSCAYPPDWVASWPALLEGRAGAQAMCDVLFGQMLERPPPHVHPDNITAIVLRVVAGDETALPLEGAHEH